MRGNYIVDGSNLVRTLYGFDERHLPQDALLSRQFIEQLEVYSAGWDSGVRVLVIFDGPPRWKTEPLTEDAPVQVQFCPEKTADETILGKARFLRHSKQKVTIVTEDRSLAQKIMEEGARWLRPPLFLEKMRNAGKRR
ncbi:MAG: NYN domain-containing protein [Elusimicrobia bacterium]|nr:NYN domain-containing protein [Elusimicrobiota bacterium]